MNVSSIVADYVGEWLKQHNKSYQWLANKLGVSKSLVQHMINGNRAFTSERIFQVAEVLGISLNELTNNNQSRDDVTVQLRGKLSTREGESALQNVIFSCLKDDEIRHVNEISNKKRRGY